MMRIKGLTGVWVVVTAVALSAATLDAETRTVTGTVGDAMCGAKHMMEGDEAGCTRGCVKKGSDYALIVKDKVYTLKTSSEAVRNQLDKLAGKDAKVTGELKGEVIQVTSVQPAK